MNAPKHVFFIGLTALFLVACGSDDTSSADGDATTTAGDSTAGDTTAGDTTAGGDTGDATGGDTMGDTGQDTGDATGGDTGGDTMGDTGDATGGDTMGDTGGTGETNAWGPEGRPDLGAQIDRAGRPAISTALVAPFNPDGASKGAMKDAYNASADSAKWQADFKDEIRGNLAILDALDANCGNQLLADTTETRYDFLATVLTDDRLYTHSARGTCGVYLGLEAEIVGALPEGDGGCGGRMLADDVIERSYSALAAGLLAGVDDGISEDDGTPSDSFPFLAAPSE